MALDGAAACSMSCAEVEGSLLVFGRILTVTLSLAIAAAGAAGFWLLSQGGSAQESPQQRQAPLVESAVATRAKTPPTISQTGFLQPYREVDVAFEVRGRIRSIADGFDIGRSVAPGTVLASLETDRLQAAVTQAEADLEAAEAQVSEAQQALGKLDERLEQKIDAAEKGVPAPVAKLPGEKPEPREHADAN